MNPKDSRRFGGIERLYGQAAFEAITTAHVCVVGLGGVGSWCAEALARSGVGTLTLVDGDTVAESNINRQLPALENTLGQAKASVLAQRFAAINPEGNFRAIEHFIDADNLNSIIPANAIIVDAIDSLAAKAALSAWARQNNRLIVVSGGAGGKTDPGAVTAADRIEHRVERIRRENLPQPLVRHQLVEHHPRHLRRRLPVAVPLAALRALLRRA